ncbi:MAG: glycine--tRNA ligase subunit beta [Synergistaceae bacterium]|nr:glycine--tRNA ligase subunit beta [Synergistaceae bacterium]MBQ3450271.1 glycine--tRNA ligase subunit beta [Synergistaceae bacterium]
MAIKNIILEIGTEEIPSRFIPDALDTLKRNAESSLKANRIEFRDAKTYATPRRLVLLITGVSENQSEQVEIVKGPPVSAAYDKNGIPTRAAEGFAKSRGITIDALREHEYNGVKYIVAEVKQESKNTLDVLPDIMTNLIAGLTFPKSMYWDKSNVRFARPIRWIAALADDKLIPFKYGDISSGRRTSGHRFMGRKVIEVQNASEFLDVLYDNSVILDQEKRLQKMKSAIANIQKDFEGNLEVEMDEKILEENLYLVEFPVPFAGSFDKRYLEIPEEVLTTSMKKNQKYLAVRSKDKGGKLANYFVGVSNNRVPDMNVIREGNERVLRARLEDAAFFWDEDRKIPLASYVDRLKTVTYQEKLGSVYDKVMLTRELALWLCRTYGFDDIASLVDRAAYLSKADLVTSMVFEFPDLQGIMGREYAKCSGEDPRVALAIHEQYLPPSAAGKIPTDDVGAILGIAERLHIITACHKVGLAPTSSQDPYGLRRAARCINAILFARSYSFNMKDAIKKSCEINSVDDDMMKIINEFMRQKLQEQLREKGYSYEIIALAMEVSGDVPYQVMRLIDTLEQVKAEEWFSALANSAVRVKNILLKNANEIADVNVDVLLMTEDSERALLDEITRLEEPVSHAVNVYDWSTLTRLLAELSPVIAKFFDSVMVMDKDEKVRRNRLALLSKCNALMKEAGDLSVLSVKK